MAEASGINDIMTLLGNISKITSTSKLTQQIPSASAHSNHFDINEYFKQNTVGADALCDDDLMMVSRKTQAGYQASFVRLGDIKQYINNLK